MADEVRNIEVRFVAVGRGRGSGSQESEEGFGKAAADAKKASEAGAALDQVLGRLTATFVITYAAMRIFSIVLRQAMAAAQQAAVDFSKMDESLRRVQIATGISDASFSGLVEQIVQGTAAGDSYGQGLRAQAEALAIIAGMGITTADSLAVLKDAERLALITGADLTKVTRDLVTVMRAWGFTAAQSAELTRIYRNAVIPGIVSTEDLSQTLSELQNSAALFGTSIETITAGLEVLRTRGLSTSQAIEIMRNQLVRTGQIRLRGLNAALADQEGKSSVLSATETMRQNLAFQWEEMTSRVGASLAAIAVEFQPLLTGFMELTGAGVRFVGTVVVPLITHMPHLLLPLRTLGTLLRAAAAGLDFLSDRVQDLVNMLRRVGQFALDLLGPVVDLVSWVPGLDRAADAVGRLQEVMQAWSSDAAPGAADAAADVANRITNLEEAYRLLQQRLSQPTGAEAMITAQGQLIEARMATLWAQLFQGARWTGAEAREFSLLAAQKIFLEPQERAARANRAARAGLPEAQFWNPQADLLAQAMAYGGAGLSGAEWRRTGFREFQQGLAAETGAGGGPVTITMGNIVINVPPLDDRPGAAAGWMGGAYLQRLFNQFAYYLAQRVQDSLPNTMVGWGNR